MDSSMLEKLRLMHILLRLELSISLVKRKFHSIYTLTSDILFRQKEVLNALNKFVINTPQETNYCT